MNMDGDDVYRELQRHLDRMPVPFPATTSGVEIRILKHLFTPEEARAALFLSAMPEPLAIIHDRARPYMDLERLRDLLDEMARKGSIQKFSGSTPRYCASPLAIGMYEAQVDRLTAELEREMRAYLDEGFGPALLNPNTTPQMRTVPVHKSIDVDRAVASYDDLRNFVQQSPGPFAAMNCVCRIGKDLTGEPCRQTKERRNCLLFGAAAQAMCARDTARELTRDEMLALLERADSEGLVLQPQNTQDPLFVCCCCGCCCCVLTTAKKFPRPAEFFQTDFVAEVDGDTCEICGTCATRCTMDAITAAGSPAVVDKGRCIGCGLCVTTCPSGALRLRSKDSARKPPPDDVRALYTRIFVERYGLPAGPSPGSSSS